MGRFVRLLGAWVLRRIGFQILGDLRSGNVVRAGRRLRHAGRTAARLAGAIVIGLILLLVLLVALLARTLS